LYEEYFSDASIQQRFAGSSERNFCQGRYVIASAKSQSGGCFAQAQEIKDWREFMADTNQYSSPYLFFHKKFFDIIADPPPERRL
jgi:hypothetical protein